MRFRNEIPIARIAEALRYEPDTGKLYWIKQIAPKCRIGREAGNGTGRRDFRISVDGVLYQAHRLAWALVTGQQPPDNIDHVNLDTRDNRWANLREATTPQNGANRTHQKNSTTKKKGVYFVGSRNKPWLARLQVNSVIVLNKHFATETEARDAYTEAAKASLGDFYRA